MDMNLVGYTIQSSTSVIRENLDQEINGNLRTENSTKECGTYKRSSLTPRIVCSGK